jgi:hypothetical protein
VKDHGVKGLEVFSVQANGSKWFIDARKKQLIRANGENAALWEEFIQQEFA